MFWLSNSHLSNFVLLIFILINSGTVILTLLITSDTRDTRHTLRHHRLVVSFGKRRTAWPRAGRHTALSALTDYTGEDTRLLGIETRDYDGWHWASCEIGWDGCWRDGVVAWLGAAGGGDGTLVEVDVGGMAVGDHAA